MLFDGDDYCEPSGPSSDIDVTSAITIAAWVCPESVTGGHYIFTKCPSGSADTTPCNYNLALSGDEFFFYTTSNTPVRNAWTTSSVNLTAVTDGCVSAAGWTHVAVTYDEATDAVFYVNGRLVSSSITVGTCCVTMGSDNTRNGLGRRQPLTGAGFEGRLAWVYLLDGGVLSAGQIAELWLKPTSSRGRYNWPLWHVKISGFTDDLNDGGTAGDCLMGSPTEDPNLSNNGPPVRIGR